MAETIPETLPRSGPTAGERRVFAALAKLPDDCLIYYEPVVARRYPDLIAILPEVGVLIIEVKDWRLAELSRAAHCRHDAPRRRNHRAQDRPAKARMRRSQLRSAGRRRARLAVLPG
jgi:hypothetical protein